MKETAGLELAEIADSTTPLAERTQEMLAALLTFASGACFYAWATRAD